MKKENEISRDTEFGRFISVREQQERTKTGTVKTHLSKRKKKNEQRK